MRYITPGGSVYDLYTDIINQPHVLIAGATGSGKSVLINGLIATMLYSAPCERQMILIDPKRVELREYRRLPHCIRYASEPEAIRDALTYAVELMEQRYRGMRRTREYSGAHVYVIIDELADLLTTDKRAVTPLLARLTQLGRAARIHVIAATQRPTRDIINGQIAVNMDARVALRCPTAQDSRNIIHVPGAEALPRYGQAYYLTPEGLTLTPVPMLSDSERERLIEHWQRQTPLWRRIFHP